MTDPLSLEIGLCWGTLQNASLTGLIEAAGRHGFPTLSIRPDMVRACLENGTSAAALRRHLADAGVRRINVSLDSLDPDRFGFITRGGDLATVLDGIAAARAKGRMPGRQPLNMDKVEAAIKLIEASVSPTEDAKQLGIGRSTIYREMRRLGIRRPA